MSPESFQRVCCCLFAPFQAGCQFIRNCCVRSFQTTQAGIQLRDHNKVGKLSSEQINGDECHCRQQSGGYHTDEDVSDNQPVAKSPQKSFLEPAISHNGEQNDDPEAQEEHPAGEALSVGKLE